MEDYFEIDDFIFKILPNSQIYDDKYFQGIIYTFEKCKYDIFLNKSASWGRIYIYYSSIYSSFEELKDMPLNNNTIKLLPDVICARRK